MRSVMLPHAGQAEREASACMAATRAWPSCSEQGHVDWPVSFGSTKASTLSRRASGKAEAVLSVVVMGPAGEEEELVGEGAEDEELSGGGEVTAEPLVGKALGVVPLIMLLELLLLLLTRTCTDFARPLSTSDLSALSLTKLA